MAVGARPHAPRIASIISRRNWFNAFSNRTEVRGFENLPGMTSANQMFSSCTNLASVTGMGNLGNVQSMRYTFSSCAFSTLDLRGFDPSHLADLFYCFSGCGEPTIILADSTWALPTSGISGMQCFYNCSTSLIGGNGTVWASSNVGYTYMRIDRAGQTGYLTAA